MSAQQTQVSFAEAFRFWLKLGFISFGGPAGQINVVYLKNADATKLASVLRASASTDTLAPVAGRPGTPAAGPPSPSFCTSAARSLATCGAR